jgi:ABC-2 type transport system ATP-binding protein
LTTEVETYAIAVEDLTKNYGSLEALKGLCFRVHKGEFFGLLGPNGAGKTTTIGMLAGFIEATRGRIFIDGVDARAFPMAAKRKLGLVPQEFAFYPTLSALDNLLFFGHIYGLRGKKLKDCIRKVVEMVELSDRIHDSVSQFSNGMKRRLNIAIGLLHEPQILILDEPTVGVDAQSRHSILEGLRELHRKGISILFSTHYMEEAQRMCDRVAILDQGRMIALDSPLNLVRTVGTGVIQVEFSTPCEEAFLQHLNRFFPVKEMNGEKNGLYLEVANREEALQYLFKEVQRWNLTIRKVHLPDPGLETVFLRLTGKHMRDWSP